MHRFSLSSLTILIQQLVLLTDCQKSKIGLHNLDGKHVKASAFHYPPFFIIDQGKDGNTTYSGYCFSILEWIATSYNIKMIFVPVNQLDVVEYGITQAIINQLIKKQVDIVPMVLIPTAERSRIMDFTIPLLIGNSRLMLRYPDQENQLTAITRPFSTLIWTLFGLSILALIGTMVIFNCFKVNIPSNYSIVDVISSNTLLVISMFTGQGFYIPQKLSRTIIRISIGLWCLMAVVICNAYTGTLISFLTVPKLEPVINSLEELAASKRYKLTAEINSAFTDRFLVATSGYYKTLGDSLRKNPQLLYSDLKQATNNVLNHDAVFVKGGIDILTRVSEDVQANGGKCRLTVSKPTGDILFLSFGLSKELEASLTFNNRLKTLWESGLLTHWFKQYIPNIDKCLITTNNVAKVQKSKMISFSISQVSGIFLLLIVGLLLSILTFLGELAIGL